MIRQNEHWDPWVCTTFRTIKPISKKDQSGLEDWLGNLDQAQLL